MKLKIDPEFKALIPPLYPTEREELEASCLREGIRHPLVAWKNVLVDGHTRLDIATKHQLEYEIESIEFPDRDAAIVWVINNQVGRRNLSATDRVKLLQRKKGILELQAKARMLATLKQGDEAPAVANLPQRDAGRVRDQLAKEAGVSPHTYAALAKVVEHGTEELQQATRDRRISASTAAKVADLPPEVQKEIVKHESRKEVLKAVQERFPEHTEPEIRSGLSHIIPPPSPPVQTRITTASMEEEEDVPEEDEEYVPEDGQEEEEEPVQMERQNRMPEPVLMPADNLPELVRGFLRSLVNNYFKTDKLSGIKVISEWLNEVKKEFENA